jgi:polyphosphate kinase
MPVDAPHVRRQLRFVLEVTLSDNRRRWVMDEDGDYDQVTPGEDEPVRDVQEILMDATERAVEEGADVGMSVDEDLIDGDLLIEPTSESTEATVHPPVVADGRVAVDADLPEADSNSADTDADLTEADVDANPAEPDVDADADASDDGRDADDSGESVFEAHPDRWYRPDSERYEWAVRTSDGERRYFETREGAAERLRTEYE